MNRGRRRGGGPSLSGLRDGVKRRLFDPNSVPTKPDPKYEVNRLIPIVFSKPLIQCYLGESKNASLTDKRQTSPSADQFNLVHLTGLMEYAFSTSPFYHSLPVHSEGIDVGHLGRKNTPSGTHSSQNSLLHLLVARDDVNRWGSDGPLKNAYDPDDWHPPELVSRIKSASKNGSRRAAKRRKRYVADMSELITDRMIQQVTEVLPENDDEIVEKPDADKDDQEADSEDDRWNGEVNPAEDPDDIDDEEFDNDYCQAYFDNGERDFSDEGDDADDGGGRYFD